MPARCSPAIEQSLPISRRSSRVWIGAAVPRRGKQWLPCEEKETYNRAPPARTAAPAASLCHSLSLSLLKPRGSSLLQNTILAICFSWWQSHKLPRAVPGTLWGSTRHLRVRGMGRQVPRGASFLFPCWVTASVTATSSIFHSLVLNLKP